MADTSPPLGAPLPGAPLPEAGRIVYLSVPESLRAPVEDMHGDGHHRGAHEEHGRHFTIDPAIPIPVELRPDEDQLDLENLSWEMILSGMIRVVAAAPDDDDADYYRHFVRAVKPDILNEFTTAAIMKAKNGDFDLALDIIAALKGLFPRAPQVLLNYALILEDRAALLERLGREADAEAALERVEAAWNEALDVKPPLANASFNAGFFFMKRCDFNRARECFSTYIALTDDEVEEETGVKAGGGLDSGMQAKRNKARAVLKEIDSRALDDAIFHEAYELIRSGAEERGMEKARDFLERHPSVWNGWFLLGWALRRLGRWTDGAAAFRKTLELGGDTGDTRNELAICLMEGGDLKGARRELETALRVEPENVKIISNLGTLAHKAGNDTEAAAFFSTVLDLAPDDPVAQAFLKA